MKFSARKFRSSNSYKETRRKRQFINIVPAKKTLKNEFEGQTSASVLVEHCLK